jgi:hypothetical protein
VGLDRADIMFENMKIAEMALSRAGGQYAEKAGDDFAMIVVDTTRGNPGWQDVNRARMRS